MIVCVLNPYEQHIPGYVRFGIVHVHESFQKHICISETISVLWVGTIFNRDVLQTDCFQTDEEIIIALYQQVGMEEMLRKINADFTLFLLLDANLYGSETLLFIASPSLPCLLSSQYYLGNDTISDVVTDDSPHLLSVATYRVWRKSFQVCSQWVLDPQTHIYFLPPVPIHVPHVNVDAIVHLLAKESILKKWRAHQSPPVVLLFQREQAENPSLFAFLQEVLSSVCECRIVSDMEEELSAYVVFLISYSAWNRLLCPFSIVVYPLQERDLYQFLTLIPFNRVE